MLQLKRLTYLFLIVFKLLKLFLNDTLEGSHHLAFLAASIVLIIDLSDHEVLLLGLDS
jgi:hypothetical protein